MIKADTAGFKSEKILGADAAAAKIRELKKNNKTTGLCNGGFDLLHPGHIKHLESAKKLCDCLIVAVTSDKPVAARKGKGRPIFQEELRAYSVASIQYVDYVVISAEKAPDLIKQLKPSYYIKGPDFIEKTTPGITSEREAIRSAGGEIKYTTDPKLSTTEIIRYIHEEVKREKMLLVIDRDGTLVEEAAYLGREKNWPDQTKPKKDVIDLLIYIKTKHDATMIVVSNQQGIARGYFDAKRVGEVNRHIDGMLRKKGITIDNWQHCPYVDAKYAATFKEGFNKDFIKEKTGRKPDTEMALKALHEINKKIADFDKIIVIGNNQDDAGLAKNLHAAFIDVTGKGYEKMKKTFDSL